MGSTLHSGSVRAEHPAAPGSILGIPKKISKLKLSRENNNSMLSRYFDDPAERQEDRGLMMSNKHLVLASGKLVLQKR